MLSDIDLIEYCRLKFKGNNVEATNELERIAKDCAILDNAHPQQGFSFFANSKYLNEIAQEVYTCYEQEACLGDGNNCAKPILPIGMIINLKERNSVVLKYHTYVISRPINEPR